MSLGIPYCIASHSLGNGPATGYMKWPFRCKYEHPSGLSLVLQTFALEKRHQS